MKLHGKGKYDNIFIDTYLNGLKFVIPAFYILQIFGKFLPK